MGGLKGFRVLPGISLNLKGWCLKVCFSCFIQCPTLLSTVRVGSLGSQKEKASSGEKVFGVLCERERGPDAQ